MKPNGTIDVFPDLGAVHGQGELAEIVGALMTLVLVVAVLMLIVGAVAWALASQSGHYLAASRARAAVWVAVGAAGLTGAAVVWANFLIGTGTGL